MKTKEETPPLIVSTWGTGSDKKTMALHIKRAVYSQLGWKTGDFLLLTPDYKTGKITLEKLNFKR